MSDMFKQFQTIHARHVDVTKHHHVLLLSKHQQSVLGTFSDLKFQVVPFPEHYGK